MQNDHYGTLGVDAGADAGEVRAAYLRIMREHHPDHRPGDAAAADVARRANEAYEVLGDAARRAVYDRLRQARTGHTEVRSGTVRVREPGASVVTVRAQPPRPPAYSQERASYQQAFTTATLRAALVVLAIGVLLLLLTVAR